ncbi:hypothetical protein JM83_0916 [Gillisia sp. Hel_I_86]|uniref:hypothetical protein n=1 Tax=Gillisia sp. Hel_I_86 TaxID=1249981 RepID=UPI00119A6C32|nr:hypothetical protein [Gillisia sp. Hel_I_86]TVZ25974.1 hypothetical protein JM83_0916 [Gillisia sp. Hel_I_86]
MHKFFYLSAILLIVACNSSKNLESSASKQFFVEDLLEMNAEEIKNSFPNEVITEDVGLFEEGTEERAYTVISPNSPDELHITWKDKNRTRIEDIRMGSNGKWKSKTAIKIGSSYEELTQMNQKPISFYGFGWDYSGAVQWNDGKLEKSNVHVFLAPEKEPKNKFYGDQIVKATPEEIKELDLKVKAILFKP